MPGKPVADAVFANLEPRIAALRASGHNPGLGTILVGGDSASAGYIRMKQEMAAALGFGGRHVQLPGEATQADLIAAIRDFNTDDAVDAVQRHARGSVGRVRLGTTTQAGEIPTTLRPEGATT